MPSRIIQDNARQRLPLKTVGEFEAASLSHVKIIANILK